MNILLISRCPPYPLYLGDRLIVYHLAQELRRRGHVIDLIALSDRFEDITEREHYADLFGSVTILADPKRTQLDYANRWINPGARFPTREDQAWSRPLWAAIRQHVTANRYDVAHVFGGVQVYEYINAVQPLPAIITPYESYSLYLRRLFENADSVGARQRLNLRLQWRITRSYESFMFTPYRRVIVVSEPDRAELLALNHRLPLEVIPNGVDLDYFKPLDQPREPHTLIFTGNYEYTPNVDAALRLARDLFPRIRARIPDAQLWIVGNAPPPELRSLASNSIIVTGYIPDVRDYLNRATVFVAPLRLGAGIKNKVLEALALECAVVATPLSVDGIAARDGSELLIAELDDQMVDSILRLLDDSALRERLGRSGRELIKAHYSWAQVAQRYEALYAEVAR
ncbi:MAG TPA: glycosyltransferase family 4 protein [Phototrophicaceae bacterium]|nr:glycosyltransferase family 4 protein [Phototrophicaceae bacterium]